MSALEKAISAAEGVSNLAASIGVRQNVVSNWRARGQVPLERCAAIEAATGVTCELLRPDVTWLRDKKGRPSAYQVPLGPTSEAA